MPQQRPGSQQHCILVILPGSSCAQRPFTRPEKHVPVLWSKHGKRKQKTRQNYPESSHHLLYTLGDAELRGLFYSISITSHSFHFYHIYSYFCLFTNKYSLSTCAMPYPTQVYKKERHEAAMSPHAVRSHTQTDRELKWGKAKNLSKPRLVEQSPPRPADVYCCSLQKLYGYLLHSNTKLSQVLF